MEIEVTLAFWYKGATVEAGDRLDVPDHFGRELIAMGKAVVASAVSAESGETAKPAKAKKVA